MTRPAPAGDADAEQPRQSLSIEAARNLVTTGKSAPQTRGISARWLLKVLPWVPVGGGVYRLNRRLTYQTGEGRVSFTQVGAALRVIPQALNELALWRGFEDAEVLESLADRFAQRSHESGDVIVEEGQPADRLFLIAAGKVLKTRPGPYGDLVELGVLADGDAFGDRAVLQPSGRWEFTVKAVTRCTVLTLTREAFAAALAESEALREHLADLRARLQRPQDKDHQAAIAMAAGHAGEPALPGAFVDYERHPREYELSVVQTILNVHSRVADLYNSPMDQMKEQLRLTIEALREREEYQLINHPEFGLVHNVHHKQRVHARRGAPTPDDMDDLLSRRRKTQFFMAHPRAIAAFGKECTRRGIYPETKTLDGRTVQAWRGVPFLPCPNIPVGDDSTTTVLAFRIGEEHQGIIGLRPDQLPDQHEPGLNVRFMGINEQGICRYLVSAYHSVAVLVPNALGALLNVQVGR